MVPSPTFSGEVLAPTLLAVGGRTCVWGTPRSRFRSRHPLGIARHPQVQCCPVDVAPRIGRHFADGCLETMPHVHEGWGNIRPLSACLDIRFTRRFTVELEFTFLDCRRTQSPSLVRTSRFYRPPLEALALVGLVCQWNVGTREHWSSVYRRDVIHPKSVAQRSGTIVD